MTVPFAPLGRTLAVLAAFAFATAPAFAQTPPPAELAPPPADLATPLPKHLKECHGFVRHVSDLNIKVHCIDGNASDISFLYLPRYANLRDGKSVQTRDLAPDTPVHVLYTQVGPAKKAYKIFVADPNGHGIYGFRT
jgi:hypothetical protein